MKLEDLPEGLRRECEEFDRRGRIAGRIDIFLGVLVAAGFIAAVVSLVMILMAGR